MERFAMKDISNSPDIVNPRYLSTPNLSNAIRATSTPRTEGIKFISPCASPVIFTEITQPHRLCSPICSLTRNSNVSRSNKILDHKITQNDENFINLTAVMSNKRFMQDSLNSSADKQESKKLLLDVGERHHKFEPNYGEDFNNSGEIIDVSMIMEDSVNSLMDVDSSIAIGAYELAKNKSVLRESSFLLKNIQFKNKYRVSNCLVDNFSIGKENMDSLNDSNFILPRVDSESKLKDASMTSLDSFTYKLPKMLMSMDRSQNENSLMQYPSFERYSSNNAVSKSLDEIDCLEIPRSENGVLKNIENNQIDPDNQHVSDASRSICSESHNPDNPVESESKILNLSGCIEDGESNFEQTSNLISDYSRPYCLPYLKSHKHPDLKAIKPQTAEEILNGHFLLAGTNFVFIDCRYPYEYFAGHLLNATNCYKFSDLLNYIKILDPCDAQIFIFYCEFSSERAPKMLHQLRKWDRWSNRSHYPRLTFPELYIIEGGYKNIFELSPDACTTPLSYTPMLDERFAEDLKYYETMKKNEKTKRCKEELKRIFNQARLRKC